MHAPFPPLHRQPGEARGEEEGGGGFGDDRDPSLAIAVGVGADANDRPTIG